MPSHTKKEQLKNIKMGTGLLRGAESASKKRTQKRNRQLEGAGIRERLKGAGRQRKGSNKRG